MYLAMLNIGPAIRAALILQQEELNNQAELTADLALAIKIIPAASVMIICPYLS
jgi:hypothetical protein